MRKVLALGLLIGTVGTAGAEPTTLGGAPFALPPLGDIRAAATAIPMPTAVSRPTDPLDDYSLFPEADEFKPELAGHASTEAEYRRAVAVWTEALARAGLQPGTPTWDRKATLAYLIPYRPLDGRVLRRFDADPHLFKPKDLDALEADKAAIAQALERAGMKVVASPTTHFKGYPQSYSLYFLTRPAARSYHEIRPRVLAGRGDIDFKLLEAGGVAFIEKPKPALAVYLGSEVLWWHVLELSRQDAQREVDYFVALRRKEGCPLIGTKIYEDLSEPSDEYPWIGDVYYYDSPE